MENTADGSETGTVKSASNGVFSPFDLKVSLKYTVFPSESVTAIGISVPSGAVQLNER